MTLKKYITNYSVQDARLSVLAWMFYKSSKIFKKRMYQNNLETQFYVQRILKDTQIRAIIKRHIS